MQGNAQTIIDQLSTGEHGGFVEGSILIIKEILISVSFNGIGSAETVETVVGEVIDVE